MVIGAGDIDFNGGVIGGSAIVDGDLVGEGECFAVSEELEGLVPRESKFQSRIAALVAASMTLAGLTWKKELKSTPLKLVIGVGASGGDEEALALTTLEVSRSSMLRVPESVVMPV